ncbi:hypothetical protein TI05_09610 [Achromatium sp. WMS3]|nr:hypothetical protein TI05_09610 [Achromatium sp. WMS3]
MSSIMPFIWNVGIKMYCKIGSILKYSKIANIYERLWHWIAIPFCVILGLGLSGCGTTPKPQIQVPKPKPPVQTTKSKIPQVQATKQPEHIAKLPPIKIEPIPQNGRYQIKTGDTLFSVATRFGLDLKQLGEWNGIEPPYQVNIGQILRLTKPKVVGNRVQQQYRPLIPPRVVKRKSEPTRKPQHPAPKIRRQPLPPSNNTGPWIWPTEGQVIGKFVKGDKTRQGIHIEGTFGQAIIATRDGKVLFSGKSLRKCGSLIIIKHDKKYLSAYECISKPLVQDDAWVSQGKPIGQMGHSTDGKATLYFEIRREEKVLNPIRFLPVR